MILITPLASSRTVLTRGDAGWGEEGDADDDEEGEKAGRSGAKEDGDALSLPRGLELRMLLPPRTVAGLLPLREREGVSFTGGSDTKVMVMEGIGKDDGDAAGDGEGAGTGAGAATGDAAEPEPGDDLTGLGTTPEDGDFPPCGACVSRCITPGSRMT
jgi:hypothetical protein